MGTFYRTPFDNTSTHVAVDLCLTFDLSVGPRRCFIQLVTSVEFCVRSSSTGSVTGRTATTGTPSQPVSLQK